MHYILGIDIGTTATKGILYQTDGQVFSTHSRANQLIRGAQGQAEQNPEAIYQGLIELIQEVSQGLNAEDMIDAVALSCQMHSLILLDQAYSLLTPSITWADTRAKSAAEAIKDSEVGQRFMATSGTPIHPMSWLAKVTYFQKKEPQVMAQTAHLMGIKDYLFYRLFDVNAIDISSATGTGLVNLQKGTWDQDILDYLAISPSLLPEIKDSLDYIEGIPDLFQGLNGLTAETRFLFGAGDGPMANLGIGKMADKAAVITIGTSSAVRLLSQDLQVEESGSLFTYAVKKGLWVIGGPSNSGGNILEWLHKTFYQGQALETIFQDIQATPIGADKLCFLPYLGGERAPLWDSEIRGSFHNLSFTHQKAHFARACMEGLFYNIRMILESIEEHYPVDTLYVSGGLFQTQLFSELLADITGKTIIQSDEKEVGCRAAFILSKEALGQSYTSQRQDQAYYPNAENHRLYTEAYEEHFKVLI
ncbi:gluconokinase [Streptococcus bovimastitidis]|uniref:Gluconokinase n=1 Tax=Streptococcus bovimastitidis TaxID=1856638 RepID=A0A1L8MKS6_9STRE|nr:gluconokinase [Streptococcus bovimastitidis]OJF71338.1 gluconokinase [Streptococcus bovimastitidis]